LIVALPELSPLEWKPNYRLIASRLPPAGLFDRVADPADLASVFYVENLTDPRMRQEAGDISLVPLEARLTGPGTTPIMAAFTHLYPEGSRFTDGTWGVYYAARSLDTAIAESRHSRARFLARTHEGAMEIDMCTYLTDVAGELHDIRGLADRQDVYHPDSYAAGQALGRELKHINSWGIAYDSVRHSGGECVAVFRPKVLFNCRQGPHFRYVWNGTEITDVLAISLYQAN
jgi:hypothetical protein